MKSVPESVWLEEFGDSLGTGERFSWPSDGLSQAMLELGKMRGSVGVSPHGLPIQSCL